MQWRRSDKSPPVAQSNTTPEAKSGGAMSPKRDLGRKAMEDSSNRTGGSGFAVPRRTLLKGAGVAGLSGVLGTPFINRLKAMEAHPLAGKKIEMNILGIAGWLPSSLGVKMSP